MWVLILHLFSNLKQKSWCSALGPFSSIYLTEISLWQFKSNWEVAMNHFFLCVGKYSFFLGKIGYGSIGIAALMAEPAAQVKY